MKIEISNKTRKFKKICEIKQHAPKEPINQIKKLQRKLGNILTHMKMKTYQTLQGAMTVGLRVQIIALNAGIIDQKILNQQPKFTVSETRRTTK